MSAKRSVCIEAERSFLGAILIKPDLFPSCSVIAEDFGNDRHRTIFAAMAKVDLEGVGIDLVTLKNEIAQSGQIAQAGGLAYIAGIVDGVPAVSAERLAAWEQIIRQAAAIRRVEAAFERGLEELKSGADAASAIETARQGLDRVSTSCGTSVNLAVSQQVDAASKAMQTPPSPESGVSTGIPSLTRLAGTFGAGKSIVVAARPGTGKTTLLINIGETAARSGKGALMFSAEMQAIEIHKKRLCAESGLSEFRLENGLNPREREAFDRAISRVRTRPFFIDDTPALTLTEIRAKCRFIQALPEGLGLVIVDYLQLFVQSPKYGTREGAVADFSRGLKRLSMDLGVPVLCASQLNRSSEREEREPRLSDLRESGAIEQDADLVLFLHREDGSDNVRAILAKARNRATGRTDLRFNGALSRFEDPAFEENASDAA